MAFDAFLKLGDGSKAKGESTDTVHPNEIEVSSFSFSLSNPSSVGSGTTGSGSGKVQFGTFNCTALTCSASAVLLQMCASGDHFDKATLTVRKAGGKKALEYYIIEFTEFYVDGMQILADSAKDDKPREAWSFSCGSMHVKYTPQKSDGTGGSAIEGGWDVTTNQAK